MLFVGRGRDVYGTFDRSVALFRVLVFEPCMHGLSPNSFIPDFFAWHCFGTINVLAWWLVADGCNVSGVEPFRTLFVLAIVRHLIFWAAPSTHEMMVTKPCSDGILHDCFML